MSQLPLPQTASTDTYRRRRAALAADLKRPLVVFAGHAPARNYAGNPHPFRAGSTYLYFGGPPIENACWLIEPTSDGDDGCTLLRNAPAPDDPLWLGEPIPDAILAAFAGISESRIEDAERLKALLAGRNAGFVAPPYPETIATSNRLGLQPANDNESRAIIRMRLIKDDQEMTAMRRAVEAGVAGHRAAMAATVVGGMESDTEAALISAFAARQCRPSFSPIVTVRGEVLHGSGAGRRLDEGALMLVDAGAEEPGGYASDITRTFPVSGKWTDIQRQLYDTTLRAQRTAIDACRPGRRYRDVHHAAARVISEGLVEAGLLRGAPGELADRGAYALFFPHGVGHLIGLDVHEMEDYGDLAGYPDGRVRPERFGDRSLRLDRDLEPGMVVTVEPGIYLVPDIWRRQDLVAPFADAVDRPAVDALLESQFGGIRIEEQVHIQPDPADAPEVLTAALPNDADEVARLVGGRAL